MDARHFLFNTGEALGNQKMITVACGDYSHSSTPRVTSPTLWLCVHVTVSFPFCSGHGRQHPAHASRHIHTSQTDCKNLSLHIYMYNITYGHPSGRPIAVCWPSRDQILRQEEIKRRKKKRGSIVAFCFDGTWPTPSSTSWISLIFLSSLPSSLHLRGRCWIGFWSSSSSSPLVRFVAVLHLEDTHEKSPMCHSSSMKFRGNALRRPLLPWFSPSLDSLFYIIGFFTSSILESAAFPLFLFSPKRRWFCAEGEKEKN